MRQTATVIGTEGKFATVLVVRSSMCEGCHNSGTCTACSLLSGKKTAEARALNTASASVGDKVAVESAAKTVLTNAFLVFMMPLLSALAAYFIFSGNSKTTGAIAALCGFALTISAVGIYSALSAKKRCDIEIVEIISSAEKNEQ